eukprot:3281469-Pyramimonas_sp.AAC.1
MSPPAAFPCWRALLPPLPFGNFAAGTSPPPLPSAPLLPIPHPFIMGAHDNVWAEVVVAGVLVTTRDVRILLSTNVTGQRLWGEDRVGPS